MGTDKRFPIVAAGALVALVACANIAGLEGPAPTNGANAEVDAGDTGREAAPGITVKPESVAIRTSCAGGGDSSFITIENENDAPSDYELQVPEGSAFALRDETGASVSQLKGTVPAKGLVLVYLVATPTKAGAFSSPVIVRIGERVTQVPVQVTVSGGALAFTPDLVDFGEVRRKTPSQAQTVVLENTGTEAVNVLAIERTPESDAGAEFAIDTGSGSINLAPGQKASATVTLESGNEGPQVTEVFEPRPQQPTCGALPKLTLKGTRVNQDVTINPASVDFGDVDCLSTGGATRTITVSNFGGDVANFEIAQPADSWFEVTTENATTTVPKASGATPGTVTITVKLKVVGSTIGNHAEAISVKVTKPTPEKTTTVTATVKSVGGVLDISPLTLSGFSAGGTKSFYVRNVGNKFVYVRHTSSNPTAFTVSDRTEHSALDPGVFLPFNVDVKFVAAGSGSYLADIVTEKATSPPLYPSSGNLCLPAPVVKVSATR